MFDKFKRSPLRQRIDLASVRDTLLYIESDLNEAPELHRLADADVVRFRDHLESREGATTTKQLRRRIVGSFLSWCSDRGYALRSAWRESASSPVQPPPRRPRRSTS